MLHVGAGLQLDLDSPLIFDLTELLLSEITFRTTRNPTNPLQDAVSSAFYS